MENCQGGCPCEQFDCSQLESPTDLRIYALDSVTWEDKEVKIQWNVTSPGVPISITPSEIFSSGVDQA